jgi:hypothetical protein
MQIQKCFIIYIQWSDSIQFNYVESKVLNSVVAFFDLKRYVMDQYCAVSNYNVVIVVIAAIITHNTQQ